MTNGITQDLNSVANGTNTNSSTYSNPKATLGKDDFMKLMLTELQYQDPTSPMDSEKILSQTSQLATLESADNTNKTLTRLTTQLDSNSDLNAISAIGKMGSLGSDSISLTKDSNPNFDIYFGHNIQSGTITIRDNQNNVVKTFDLSAADKGIQSFHWDGKNNSGERLDAGSYSITADYADDTGANQKAVYGVYPIESVRFDSGKALLKMGSNYYPLSNVKEIYQ